MRRTHLIFNSKPKRRKRRKRNLFNYNKKKGRKRIQGKINWRIEEITPCSATWEEKTAVSTRVALSIYKTIRIFIPLIDKTSILFKPPSWIKGINVLTTSPVQFPILYELSITTIHPIYKFFNILKSWWVKPSIR